jgi:hypothetical protein
MEDQGQHKRNKGKLIYGSIIFGITIPIGFFIIIHFGSQIEFQREHSSFLKDIFFWVIEWIFILVGIGLPCFTWKKLVKPYKDF